MLVPSDYDSDDDSDYVPDEEHSDNPDYSESLSDMSDDSDNNTPSPTTSTSSTNPILTGSYRDHVRQAKVGSLEYFFYTPTSGPNKNKRCKYIRRYTTKPNGDVVRTNQFRFDRIVSKIS